MGNWKASKCRFLLCLYQSLKHVRIHFLSLRTSGTAQAVFIQLDSPPFPETRHPCLFWLLRTAPPLFHIIPPLPRCCRGQRWLAQATTPPWCTLTFRTVVKCRAVLKLLLTLFSLLATGKLPATAQCGSAVVTAVSINTQGSH